MYAVRNPRGAETAREGVSVLKVERYVRVQTPEECVSSLVEFGPEAVLLAGGTDLIPRLNQGRLSVSTLIDLAFIPGLGTIARQADGFHIGPMCRLGILKKDGSLSGALDVLRRGAGHVSSMQVRNAATLGGNICNASPAADTVPGLLVLDAAAYILGKNGTRQVPLDSFFIGPGETVLSHDELLTGVFIPDPPPDTGAVYKKYAIRGDCDVSIVGAAAAVTLDTDGKISSARIALASAGPTPTRMRCEEQMLVGSFPETGLLDEVAAACAVNCRPVTDHRATMEYRKDMVRVLVEDALKCALIACGGNR